MIYEFIIFGFVILFSGLVKVIIMINDGTINFNIIE